MIFKFDKKYICVICHKKSSKSGYAMTKKAIPLIAIIIGGVVSLYNKRHYRLIMSFIVY